MNELPPTHVVTCFLLRHSDAEGGAHDEILILRRSERVGIYRGRWAAISGCVEQMPDAQVLVELREEVGLSESQLTLLRKGAPVDVVDHALGKHWVVHPYLFLARLPKSIAIDWEHVEARWIRPADVERYETVPMLKEVLAQIYR